MTEKEESACCYDVGTIIDNRDRIAEINQIYTSEAEAQDALSYLISKARAAESEPCQITSEIKVVDNGYQLSAKFEFAYQAETLIFQLSTR